MEDKIQSRRETKSSHDSFDRKNKKWQRILPLRIIFLSLNRKKVEAENSDFPREFFFSSFLVNGKKSWTERETRKRTFSGVMSNFLGTLFQLLYFSTHEGIEDQIISDHSGQGYNEQRIEWPGTGPKSRMELGKQGRFSLSEVTKPDGKSLNLKWQPREKKRNKSDEQTGKEDTTQFSEWGFRHARKWLLSSSQRAWGNEVFRK